VRVVVTGVGTYSFHPLFAPGIIICFFTCVIHALRTYFLLPNLDTSSRSREAKLISY